MLKSRGKKRRLIVFLLVVVILSYMYFFGKHGYFALKKMQRREDSLQVVQDSLMRELDSLQKSILWLKSNEPDIIEKEARRLGMAKTGEELIIVQVDSSAFLEEK
jgi:cell division protein FtsB